MGCLLRIHSLIYICIFYFNCSDEHNIISYWTTLQLCSAVVAYVVVALDCIWKSKTVSNWDNSKTYIHVYVCQLQPPIHAFFSCDQAALGILLSVCPSVRPYVRPSLRTLLLLEDPLYWRQSTRIDGNYRSRKITARRWLHKYVVAEFGASPDTYIKYALQTSVPLSVRPSVTHFSLCFCHRIIMKF